MISRKKVSACGKKANTAVRAALVLGIVVIGTVPAIAEATDMTEVEVFQPSDPTDDKSFGDSTAVSPGYVVFGAASDGAGDGAVYAYRRSTGEQQKIVGPTPAVSGGFGFSVAISGNTMAVGAPYDSGGTVYLYRLGLVVGVGLKWVLLKTLRPGIDAGCGWSVALDGDDLAVGCIGMVNLYERNLGGPNMWYNRQAIGSPVGTTYGPLTVAIEGDVLIIGAPYHTAYPGATESGVVYAFRFTDLLWEYDQSILPDVPRARAGFGYSVAIDGQLLAVGAIVNDEVGTESGAAYVFRESNGAFKQVCQLIASDSDGQYQHLGVSVALDDRFLLAGAEGFDNSGAAYLYDYVEHRLVALITESQPEYASWFGRAVALEGDTMVVTAPRHTVEGHTANGLGMLYWRPILVTGFETGDTTAWSAQVP